MLWFRSQGKEKEAESLLKDSIHFGPHFADAYSSLASLYADQVNHQPFTNSEPDEVKDGSLEPPV